MYQYVPVQTSTYWYILFCLILSRCIGFKSQAMSLYEINQVKTLTIETLVNGSFPAIKATHDIALPFVGPRTVAYIHTLIVDTVNVLQGSSRVSKRGSTQ